MTAEPLFVVDDPAPKPCHRGTSNADVRGNTAARRERREWLVDTYRADVDAAVVVDPETGDVAVYPWGDAVTLVFGDYAVRRPACRCYRCGCLLVDETVTADRIKPGVEGGSYGTPKRDTREGRTNIRPACGTCNSQTGQALSMARRKA